ncbi:alpha/beta fold hydrolase [Actinomycetospora sp. C-140]
MAPERVVLERSGVSLVGDRWAPSGETRGEVLLLHGAGQTRHSWEATARRLATLGFAATSIDARGHGDSDWARATEYTLTDSVLDLAAVTATFPEPPVIVGASMGGLTALVAQGERGDVARALVLVDVAPRIESAGLARILDFMTRGFAGFDSPAAAAEEVQRYNPGRPPPSNQDGLLRNLRQHDDGRWYWHWDPDWLVQSNMGDRRERDAARAMEAARAVRVPTLLIHATRSDVLSDEGVHELLDLVPDARYAQVEAGHMVAGDDNDAFAHVLIDFLDDQCAPATDRSPGPASPPDHPRRKGSS